MATVVGKNEVVGTRVRDRNTNITVSRSSHEIKLPRVHLSKLGIHMGSCVSFDPRTVNFIVGIYDERITVLERELQKAKDEQALYLMKLL